MLRAARIVGFALLALLTQCSEGARVAIAEPFPRVAQYSTNRSWGAPLTKPDGSLDSLLLRHLARYPTYTIEVAPSYPARADIVATLRRFNPRSHLLAYILAGDFWIGPTYQDNPGDVSFGARVWRVLKRTDGWLWGTDGNLWVDNYRVNLASRATADSLASLYAEVAASRLFDGFFFDDFHDRIAWTDGTDGRHLNVHRAGVETLAAMDSARTVNMTRLIATVRAAAPAGFTITCNGTSSGTLGADGWMREGCGVGGAFPTNEQARAFADTAQGSLNWLKREGGWFGQPYTRDACRLARLNLAIACLGNAVSSFSPDRDLSYAPYFGEWWYDEYAVRPAPSARADTTGTYTGWLGEAVVPASDLGAGLWSRDFPHGRVYVNLSGEARTVNTFYPMWQRIIGSRDPLTNTGIRSSVYTIPAQDALFLVRMWSTPKPER